MKVKKSLIKNKLALLYQCLEPINIVYIREIKTPNSKCVSKSPFGFILCFFASNFMHFCINYSMHHILSHFLHFSLFCTSQLLLKPTVIVTNRAAIAVKKWNWQNTLCLRKHTVWLLTALLDCSLIETSIIV